ncbi:MAG: RNA deprotection pyrophosphohydrolase [Sporolactobacillus sp.]
MSGYQTLTDYYGNEVRLAIGTCPFAEEPGHVWIICRFHDQWLLTRHSKRGLEFPGGKVEPGETAEQAARREVYEETGAHVAALRTIGQYQVIGLKETIEKTIYYAEIDSITIRADYLETQGPYFVSEFPAHLSGDSRFSFLMKDAVLTAALETIPNEGQ